MFGTGIAKGLMVTLRYLFHRPFTVQYPEELRPVPVNARTNLLWFEERCTGCSTCAQACPDGCILVATSPGEDGALNIDRYEIDFRLCMYCGLCVEGELGHGATWCGRVPPAGLRGAASHPFAAPSYRRGRSSRGCGGAPAPSP